MLRDTFSPVEMDLYKAIKRAGRLASQDGATVHYLVLDGAAIAAIVDSPLFIPCSEMEEPPANPDLIGKIHTYFVKEGFCNELVTDVDNYKVHWPL